MNVTRSVAVQQTVDVLPTPQSPREDPLATKSWPVRSYERRQSDVMREVSRAVREANADKGPEEQDTASSTASRPRWLRKVRAWLDGRWGIGHKRKAS